MSILGRHIPFRIVALVALALIVAAGALLPAMSGLGPHGMWGPPSGGPSREIRLVARGMAFYLENDPVAANPTIEVRAGERVRIVLQNRDRGFVHDFAVPALRAGVDAISWNEDASVVLDMPSTPGTYEYVCRPHGAMMRGTIVIRE